MSIAAVPLEDGSLGGTASDVAVTVGSVLTAWAVATVWTDEAAVLVAVVCSPLAPSALPRASV